MAKFCFAIGPYVLFFPFLRLKRYRSLSFNPLQALAYLYFTTSHPSESNLSDVRSPHIWNYEFSMKFRLFLSPVSSVMYFRIPEISISDIIIIKTVILQAQYPTHLASNLAMNHNCKVM